MTPRTIWSLLETVALLFAILWAVLSLTSGANVTAPLTLAWVTACYARLRVMSSTTEIRSTQ